MSVIDVAEAIDGHDRCRARRRGRTTAARNRASRCGRCAVPLRRSTFRSPAPPRRARSDRARERCCCRSGERTTSFSTEWTRRGATNVSSPLSGARNKRPSLSAAMMRRDVPTPGSTTQTKIVPAGQYGTTARRNHAASENIERRDLVREIVRSARPCARPARLSSPRRTDRACRSRSGGRWPSPLNILRSHVPHRPSAAASGCSCSRGCRSSGR